jgi:hypothetical protein
MMQCGTVQDSGDAFTEETEGMMKTELTQPQEGCQHQETIILILLVEKIRQEASVFFSHMMWMGVLHLKFQIKFYLNSLEIYVLIGVFF